MKTKSLFLYLPLLLTLMLGTTGCSSDDSDYGEDKGLDESPFVGIWRIVGTEEEGTLSEFNTDSQTVCLYADGRIAFTPYVVTDTEGKVLFSAESSESLLKMNYWFTEWELFIYYDYDHRTDTFSYSFSDDYKTMRIIRTKRGEGTVYYLYEPEDSLKGKIYVLKKKST